MDPLCKLRRMPRPCFAATRNCRRTSAGPTTTPAESRPSVPLLEPCFAALIDDFYDEIERHPDARKVITGGPAQIERLKGTLLAWLRDLLSGRYDSDYVARRWRVGWRHVEIGLDQVYTNVALSRLRSGLLQRVAGPLAGRRRTNCMPSSARSTRCSTSTWPSSRTPTRPNTWPASSGASGWRPSARWPAASPTSCATRSTSSRPPSTTCSTPATPPPEKKAEHLQRIERHVVLADGVITALSNFARMPVPNLRPFPVRAVRARKRSRSTRCPRIAG